MKTELKYQNRVDHYKKDAEFFDYFVNNKFEEQNIIRRYDQLFSLIKNHSEKKILEIGSGGGYALKNVNQYKLKYFPLDIPISNLKEIKNRSRSLIFPVSGDIFNLPYLDNSFDVVIMSEILEHLDEPIAALMEANRVLKKDGLVLISVPYNEKITYQICVHCNQPTPTHAHFHSFDRNKLKEFATEAQFESIRLMEISNKIATRLYIYIILKFLPFGLWKVLDTFLNLLFPKPSHLILQARKQITS